EGEGGEAGRGGRPRAAAAVTLIAGVGNPGWGYAGTRHNLGFEVLAELARRWSVRWRSWDSLADVAVVSDHGVVLAKPLTFMNLSGEAVGRVTSYYRIAPGDMLVIVDEINLPLARLRARRAGSAGGHNGLKSVIEHVGSEFPRLRIGVGRGDGRKDVSDHVLSRFTRDERDEVARAIGRAADAAQLFVVEGIEQTMNRYNAPEDGTEQ